MSKEYPFVVAVRPDGKKLVVGAFQMADSQGFPLVNCMDWADKNNACISIPHYFASAMEHGWDDEQTFGKIREALSDRMEVASLQPIKDACASMFMYFAGKMPCKTAPEIGLVMREVLEKKI